MPGERACLLELLGRNLAADGQPSIAPRESVGLDMLKLVELAKNHRVLPHLFKHLKSPLISNELIVHQKRALRNIALLLQVSRLLDSAGISHVAFKGPVLSQRLYGDPSLRMSSDIDVLVSPAQFREAYRLLKSSGFRCSPMDIPEDIIEEMLRHGKDVLLTPPNGTGYLELHFRLLMPPFLYAMDWDTVWRNRDTAVLCGHSLFTMSDEMCVAYLCAHGHAHRWRRLHWLFDFAYLYSKTFAGREAEALKTFERHGLVHELRTALVLARSTFGIELADPAKLPRRTPLQDSGATACVASFQAFQDTGKAAWFLHYCLWYFLYWLPLPLRKKWDFARYLKDKWYGLWVHSGKPLLRYELWLILTFPARLTARMRKAY